MSKTKEVPNRHRHVDNSLYAGLPPVYEESSYVRGSSGSLKRFLTKSNEYKAARAGINPHWA